MGVKFVRTSDGKRLAYKETGEGPTLVITAWWVSHVERMEDDPSFRRFVDSLAEKFRVVRYDRVGVGLSDRNREALTLEQELDDLDVLVERLGAKKVHLLGSSFGGPLALAFAARRPDAVDKIVIYGSAADGTRLAPREVQDAFETLVRSSWGVGARAMSDLFNPNADAEARARHAMLQRESASAEMAARFLRLHYSIDVTSRLADVRAPVLVIHRRGDRAIRWDLGRDLAASLRDATFRTLEGPEHLPWEGASDAVVAATTEFIRGEKTPAASRAELRRDGEVWTVAFRKKEARVRDSKGMGDLARLLARPGEALHVLELVGSPVVEAASDDVLDRKALRSYKERLEAIDGELEAAERNADTGRVTKLAAERKTLLERLGADVGLRGRSRKLADPVERARKTVAARIRDTLARIAAVHPDLGKHLEESVSLGVRCTYRPLEIASRGR